MSQHALEARVRATERRIDDTEDTLAAHEATMYRLDRARVRDDLRWVKLLGHLGIADVTEADVDEALDSES